MLFKVYWKNWKSGFAFLIKMEVSKRCWILILIFITTRRTVCVSQLATIIPSSHKNSFQHFLFFLPTPHSLMFIMIQMNVSCETSHFCKKHFVMSKVRFSLVHHVFVCHMFLWQPLLSGASPFETSLAALTEGLMHEDRWVGII